MKRERGDAAEQARVGQHWSERIWPSREKSGYLVLPKSPVDRSEWRWLRRARWVEVLSPGDIYGMTDWCWQCVRWVDEVEK